MLHFEQGTFSSRADLILGCIGGKNTVEAEDKASLLVVHHPEDRAGFAQGLLMLLSELAKAITREPYLGAEHTQWLHLLAK